MYMDMSRSDDVPSQVSVNTGDYPHRFDAIKAAARELETNKTDAIVASCELVGDLIPALEEALTHEDLPPRVAREIVEEISRASRNVDVEFQERDVSIDVE